MSSYSSNTFRISNEHLLLINILNTMYNDNLRQINSINNTLDNLIQSNNQIRNLLVQLLHHPQNTRRNGNRRWENNFFNNNNNNLSSLGRIMINNQPYVIDSISEFTFPRNNDRQNSINRNIGLDEQARDIFESFLQPIVIYPSQSQIESATRRVRYCDIARPVNTSCPISMEDFNDNDMVTVIRHCGHIFHSDHLNNWFRSNCRCPVCRYDIRDYSSNASTEFFNSQRDSSGNIFERNRNQSNVNQNTFVNEDNLNNSNYFNDLYNINGLLDTSGNFINSSNDIITSFLINVLNRTRNSR